MTTKKTYTISLDLYYALPTDSPVLVTSTKLGNMEHLFQQIWPRIGYPPGFLMPC